MEVGRLVRFYDCDTARKDKDYSGLNPKHFIVGTVIKIYDYTSLGGYTDVVCDILIEGGRVSKAHFL